MLIRKYDPNDFDAVVAIFRSNIPKYFSEEEETGLFNFMNERLDDYHVVEVEGEVVGAGGIALNEDIDPQTVSLCWGNDSRRSSW